MKKFQLKYCILFIFIAALSNNVLSQSCEWKLDNAVFSSADPDAAGPATGSVTFELQIRATSGTLSNISGFSFGWAWQSSSAMIPTTGGPGTGTSAPGCTAPVNIPGNIVLGPAFAGWQFNTINECFLQTQTVSGKTFDRIAIGTLENGNISLTTNFVPVMTITLWSIGTVNPEAGYAIINSSFGINPGPFPNYEISDSPSNIYGATSLTYTSGLRLGSILTPVIDPNLLTGIQILLSPVPVNRDLNIKFVSAKTLRTEIQLIDMTGKLLKSENVQINVGTTNLMMDLSAYAPGMYIISSTNPKALFREKFVIIR